MIPRYEIVPYDPFTIHQHKVVLRTGTLAQCMWAMMWHMLENRR